MFCILLLLIIGFVFLFENLSTKFYNLPKLLLFADWINLKVSQVKKTVQNNFQGVQDQSYNYNYKTVPEVPSTPELQEMRKLTNNGGVHIPVHDFNSFRSNASGQSSCPPTPVLIQVSFIFWIHHQPLVPQYVQKITKIFVYFCFNECWKSV